jgi:hypothetical protein
MQLGARTSPVLLWRKEEETSQPKLILCDPHGNSYEKPIPEGVLEQLAEIFNGLPRAVERNSGGLILVQPTQIVVIEKKLSIPLIQPEIRIKVSFKDLERDSQHRVISKKIVTNSKMLTLMELQDPLAYESQTSQNFVVDFGQGIIPVHVFSKRVDESGNSWALFVRHDELEGALLASEGSTTLRIYEVPQDCLRVLNPEISERDFQWAKQHAKALLKRNEILVPEVLATGSQVEIPAGWSLSKIEATLKNTATRETPKHDLSDELVPFGLLEE